MDQVSTMLGDLNGGIHLAVSWLFYAIAALIGVACLFILVGMSKHLKGLMVVAHQLLEEFAAARSATKMQHNISNALREVEDLIYENASELRQTRKEMASLRDAISVKSKMSDEHGGGRPSGPPRQIAAPPQAAPQAAPQAPVAAPAPVVQAVPAPQPVPQPQAPGAAYQRTAQPYGFDGTWADPGRSAARGKPTTRQQPAPVAQEPVQPVPPRQTRPEAPPQPAPAPSSRPAPKAEAAKPPAPQRPAAPPKVSTPAPRPEVPQTVEKGHAPDFETSPAAPPRGPRPVGVRPPAHPPLPPPPPAAPIRPATITRSPTSGGPPPRPLATKPPRSGAQAGAGAGIVTTPEAKALRLSSAEQAAKAPPRRVVRVLNTTVNPPEVPPASAASQAGPVSASAPPRFAPPTQASSPPLRTRPPVQQPYAAEDASSLSRFQIKDEHTGAMTRLAALARKRDEERRGRK